MTTKTKKRKYPPRPGQPVLSAYVTEGLAMRVRVLSHGRGMSVSGYIVDAIEKAAVSPVVNTTTEREEA